MEQWEQVRRDLPAGAILVGVDEVGRGPLVGDVVAGAVAFRSKPVEGLADSKALSARRREELSANIRENAIWALGRATPAEIDELNILQASLLAMRRAVDALGVNIDLILVDGRQLPAWTYSSVAVVKGDAKVEEISAASIIAKVARDQDMLELHQQWPAYGFDAHKGYPTKRHLEALKREGVTPFHRRSFAPVRARLDTDEV